MPMMNSLFLKQFFLMGILRILFSIYAMIIFVVLMLIVFVLSLASVFMGRISGSNYVYKLCGYWSDIWFFFTFIKVKKINGNLFEADQKYIVVANHISYLDIPVLVNVFRQPLRPLGKESMARIPIFGFLYRKAVVTVDRSSSENRIRSISILKSLIQRGISVLVFPEGTFNTTGRPLKEFYNGAFRVAIETQTPVKPVLFLDTFDRMHYSTIFSITPGLCRVVFLPDIETKGLTLDDMELLKQRVFNLMEENLIAHKAPWIKREEKPVPS